MDNRLIHGRSDYQQCLLIDGNVYLIKRPQIAWSWFFNGGLDPIQTHERSNLPDTVIIFILSVYPKYIKVELLTNKFPKNDLTKLNRIYLKINQIR